MVLSYVVLAYHEKNIKVDEQVFILNSVLLPPQDNLIYMN